jgi:hypothetical protein
MTARQKRVWETENDALDGVEIWFEAITQKQFLSASICVHLRLQLDGFS